MLDRMAVNGRNCNWSRPFVMLFVNVLVNVLAVQ